MINLKPITSIILTVLTQLRHFLRKYYNPFYYFAHKEKEKAIKSNSAVQATVCLKLYSHYYKQNEISKLEDILIKNKDYTLMVLCAEDCKDVNTAKFYLAIYNCNDRFVKEMCLKN